MASLTVHMQRTPGRTAIFKLLASEILIEINQLCNVQITIGPHEPHFEGQLASKMSNDLNHPFQNYQPFLNLRSNFPIGSLSSSRINIFKNRHRRKKIYRLTKFSLNVTSRQY